MQSCLVLFVPVSACDCRQWQEVQCVARPPCWCSVEGSDCTGSVIVKDLGRMQIVLGGQLLAGANSTNFAECYVTGDLSLDRPDP